MTKIMLVEDDKSLREIYGVRLLADGYEIISAGNGEEALAMAVKEHPDLILSDVMMPKISGFDMLDILRATPETKDIKVIMMTALSSADQRERGEALGADRYLVKSQVGIEDVVRSVHEVLADVPDVATPAVQKFGLPMESAAIKTKASPDKQKSSITPDNTPKPAVEPTTTPTEQPSVAAPTQTNNIEKNDVPAPQPTVETLAGQPANIASTPLPTPIETPEIAVTPTEEPVQSTQPTVGSTKEQPTDGTSAFPPVSSPQPTTLPEAPQTTPAPVPPVQLPQPTAPFSTSAPASLGDRVINPLTKPEPSMDIATMMSQELDDGSTTNPTPPSPPAV